ncbi:hypothetical protein CSIM01_10769 [Colletotrichum simmondsii]|uniref:Uncharacterized protein n=1 Tax=Colletotrichum simmondsii TaxID=703756 RepID=A0A135TUQ8_9PEZI|nr:hypothetical protein CSIM01_10769 [Colletotrichum simmondsii]
MKAEPPPPPPPPSPPPSSLPVFFLFTYLAPSLVSLELFILSKSPTYSTQATIASSAIARRITWAKRSSMSSVAAQQGSAKSPALCRLVNKYAMPARMWKHGIHYFLELYHRREQVRDLSHAAQDIAASQTTMRLWSQRSIANLTPDVPLRDIRAVEKALITHPLVEEGRGGTGAANRLRDFEQDIDLALVSSEHAGSRERQESRIERKVDAVILVDQLIPRGAGAVDRQAQPNHSQTEVLRGTGAQFSK